MDDAGYLCSGLCAALGCHSVPRIVMMAELGIQDRLSATAWARALDVAKARSFGMPRRKKSSSWRNPVLHHGPRQWKAKRLSSISRWCLKDVTMYPQSSSSPNCTVMLIQCFCRPFEITNCTCGITVRKMCSTGDPSRQMHGRWHRCPGGES